MATSFIRPVVGLGVGRYAPYAQAHDKCLVHHALGHKHRRDGFGSTPTDTAVQRDNKRSNYSNNTSIPSTTQTNKNPKKQLSFKGLCFGCGDRI